MNEVINDDSVYTRAGKRYVFEVTGIGKPPFLYVHLIGCLTDKIQIDFIYHTLLYSEMSNTMPKAA